MTEGKKKDSFQTWMADKTPPPPEYFVGALQDRPFSDGGGLISISPNTVPDDCGGQGSCE